MVIAARGLAFAGICLITVGVALNNRRGSWLALFGSLVELGASILL